MRWEIFDRARQGGLNDKRIENPSGSRKVFMTWDRFEYCEFLMQILGWDGLDMNENEGQN